MLFGQKRVVAWLWSIFVDWIFFYPTFFFLLLIFFSQFLFSYLFFSLSLSLGWKFMICCFRKVYVTMWALRHIWISIVIWRKEQMEPKLGCLCWNYSGTVQWLYKEIANASAGVSLVGQCRIKKWWTSTTETIMFSALWRNATAFFFFFLLMACQWDF